MQLIRGFLFLDVLANGVVVVAFFTHRPAD